VHFSDVGINGRHSNQAWHPFLWKHLVYKGCCTSFHVSSNGSSYLHLHSFVCLLPLNFCAFHQIEKDTHKEGKTAFTVKFVYVLLYIYFEQNGCFTPDYISCTLFLSSNIFGFILKREGAIVLVFIRISKPNFKKFSPKDKIKLKGFF